MADPPVADAPADPSPPEENEHPPPRRVLNMVVLSCGAVLFSDGYATNVSFCRMLKICLPSQASSGHRFRRYRLGGAVWRYISKFTVSQVGQRKHLHRRIHRPAPFWLHIRPLAPFQRLYPLNLPSCRIHSLIRYFLRPWRPSPYVQHVDCLALLGRHSTWRLSCPPHQGFPSSAIHPAAPSPPFWLQSWLADGQVLGGYPAGSVGCAESSSEMDRGSRNRWFIMFTNSSIDLGFVMGAFVPCKNLHIIIFTLLRLGFLFFWPSCRRTSSSPLFRCHLCHHPQQPLLHHLAHQSRFRRRCSNLPPLLAQTQRSSKF